MLETGIAVVDIETTGPKITDGDDIIQIAAVIIDEGKVICEYNDYFKPTNSIPFHIEQITGINDSDVSDKPHFNQKASVWFDRLKDCILVAHNLNFDMRVLQEAFSLAGFSYQPQALDTVILSKILLPDNRGFNLTELSQRYGFSFSNAHDALEDAKITSRIMSALAHEALKLSSKTISLMRPFLESFSNQEALFFKKPQLFIHEDYPDSPLDQETTIIATNKENNISTSVAKLIHQNYKTHHKLVTEDLQQPINPHIIDQLVIKLVEDGERVLLSLDKGESLDESIDYFTNRLKDYSIAILKHPDDLIHLGAFESLIKNYNLPKSNDQELVIITATINWLTWTQTGDYSQIHPELHASGLIDRHCPGQKTRINHYFYHKMQKQSQAADLILTHHYHLVSLIREHPTWFNLSEFNLLVVNLSLLCKQLRQAYSVDLNLSQAFTSLQSIYESMQAWGNDEEKELVQKLTKQTHKLLKQTQAYLLANNTIKTPKQHYITNYIANSSPILTQIRQDLEKKKNTLDKISYNKKFKDHLKKFSYEYKFNKFTNRLRQICQNFPHPHYWLIEGQSQNRQVFQLKLRRCPLKINHRDIDLFTAFKGVLAFSLGDFGYQQSGGTCSYLQMYDFKYYQLPKIHYQQAQLISIPSAYCSQTDEGVTYVDQINDFIVDNTDKLKDNIIVVVSSQDSLNQLYSKLYEFGHHKLSDYIILAQGISGSINKIRRRSMEFEKSIIIIDYKHLSQRPWFYNQVQVSLLIEKLPFKSPQNAHLKAKGDFLGQGEDGFFDKILYPDMVQTFKEFLVNVNYVFEVDQAYLFDERIYTKSYSNKLQRELEVIAKFELDR